MTVYLVISLPQVPYIHRIYMVLANPIYIRCLYGVLGKEITKYTVTFGVHVRLWPTLHTKQEVKTES